MHNIDPGHRRYDISVEGLTDIGSIRTENEDYFIYHNDKNLPFAYIIVADGMGGYSGGALASQLAAEVIDFELKALPDPHFTALPQQQQLQNLRDCVGNSIALANDAVRARKHTDPHLAQMGTTVVIAVIWQDQFTIANVGDSRAYLWQHEHLTQCSKDHSLVQELVDAGSISAGEARQHSHRNQLTRALGVEAQVAAEIRQFPLNDSGLLLLCSDGLSEYLDGDDISRELGTQLPLLQLCHRMVESANQQGGKDNITVVLAEYRLTAAAAGPRQAPFRGRPG